MKMRYFAILLLSAVLLTGCGGGTSTKNGTTAVTTTTESKDKTDLADLMSTQDYSCTVDDSFMYYVMYVTNNSDKVVSIDLNVTALDSSGSMVGSSSDGTKAVAPGQTGEIKITFDPNSLGHFLKNIDIVCNIDSGIMKLKLCGNVIE